jgi:hypothetical protein
MRHRLAAAAILAAALLSQHCLAESTRCRLVRIAEWPVRFEGELPVVDGAINGRKINVLLDTGAYASLLTRAAADRLGLATRGNYESMTGFGGESEVTTTRLDELYVAGAVRNNVRVRVGGERPHPRAWTSSWATTSSATRTWSSTMPRRGAPVPAEGLP